MNDSQNSHPLEGLIADYLNGHLPETDAQMFNMAMKEDVQLREMVEFERSIQLSVSMQQARPAYVPQFAKIAGRLDNPSHFITARWKTWTPSIPAVILIAIVVSYFPQGTQPVNEFETLSDIPVTYDQPILRIVTQKKLDDSALNSLLKEHDLKIIKSYPEANVIDVVSRNSVQLELLAKRLEQDQRVKFTQLKQAR